MKISVFRADITLPLGHPISTDLYPTAESTSAPLSALGVTILPEGETPVVLCALDWSEFSNGEFELWKTRLAEAAVTSPDRVALHCIHCHRAPWPDRETQAILDQIGLPRTILWEEWVYHALEGLCEALRLSLKQAVEVTEIRAGRSAALDIASQRRLLGDDGRVSATPDGLNALIPPSRPSRSDSLTPF